MMIFGGFILLAILSFAGIIPSPTGKSASQMSGDLVLWGTESENTMSIFLGKITEIPRKIKISYKQQSPETFADDLIEALAAGAGPDLIIMPQDLIVRLESKISLFTPEIYSERDFKNSFIENGEVFIRPKGIVALPVSVDPMVMYWNRDIFTNKSIALPPKYWDELLTLAPILTEKNEANDIILSTVALGEYQNVTNAKEVISTLILQTGNPLFADVSGALQPVLSGLSGKKIPPVTAVLRFYSDFVDPAKNIYSWNRSLPESKKAFLAGDLAIYFGFSSELEDIRVKNPNLNFDVALVPQIRSYPLRMTFGRTEGIAVLNVSRQKASAYFVAQYLSSPNATALLSQTNNKLSPSREILAKTPADPADQIFFDSAIISRSWLDPNREKSGPIFKSIVEDINSGKVTLEAAAELMQGNFRIITPR